jgi:hypothetical protein
VLVAVGWRASPPCYRHTPGCLVLFKGAFTRSCGACVPRTLGSESIRGQDYGQGLGLGGLSVQAWQQLVSDWTGYGGRGATADTGMREKQG